MKPDNQNYKELVESLKSASLLLKLYPKSQLYQDINTICNHLVNPNFRIAVFGPFNHGKSTLLNAMLGNRTLPIDLIPTTGAAITVKYGSDVRTRIMLTDGTEIYRSGTEILKEFAILDGDRQMRKDVASVEVFCPHPFLETGVEFVDLPGTNDREAQDNLVREQLLGVDIVVQLLDARKLMTLGERENLRDWLLDRGIKTVIFVANFLNLLELEEQKQVQNRLLFVAESFRAELPPGFSNLYRVDALPALRARLKGDVALSSSSGLVAFETALQNIAAILQQNRSGIRLPRVQNIASQLQQSLKVKIDPIFNEIKSFDDKKNAKINIKQRAEELIKRGFSASVSEFRDWLNISKLLNKYQSDAAVALAQNNFKTWQKDTLKKDLAELQLAIVKWLYQAYEFFQAERPEDLIITFPHEPQVTLPEKPNTFDDLSDPGSIAVGSGIGWLLGGPVGAAVVGSISYILNKNIQQQDEKVSKEDYHQQVAKICIATAEDYLREFSSQALSILAAYENQAQKVIWLEENQEPQEITSKRDELRRLQNGFNQLYRELEKANISVQGYQLYVEMPRKETRRTRKDTGNYSAPPPPRNSASSTKRVDTAPPRVENRVPNMPPPPSMKPHEVEAAFRTWEFDEEIEQMKAQMSGGGFRNKQQNTNQNNGNHKAQSAHKTQIEKDNIARAYANLGLQNSASMAEIKEAYRALVKKWHPDLFVGKPQLQQEAQEKMRMVNEAYGMLSAKNR
ncbi:MAG: dynamin family protein [Cyanomargarita calcarea GSE-NOS-MK-12-04C]|jgi:GTPase SAR1 family protein|uniref:Dynamin family protein n=1 Tax=Cyanomargarita calcarea GSE-NOS-MK-12-04C TaxID=2839659 RepID=A0A951UWC8_9CYAN|nr:dynamin family protein [Cyanomargarita calcarea GSE-NOS-MK-12-04C]